MRLLQPLWDSPTTGHLNLSLKVVFTREWTLPPVFGAKAEGERENCKEK